MKIDLKDVTITYGNKKILNKMNISFDMNKITMILGLNGAGKTTLIRTVMGFIKPSIGHILYDSKELGSIPIAKRSQMVSYVPQLCDNVMDYKVRDFVLLGITPYLQLFSLPQKKHMDEVFSALKEFDIDYLEDKFMSQISGGERQLAYLARAMVQNARFMLLDEPLSSLDFKRQHTFMEKLVGYIKRNNKGAILSVHDPNIANTYGDIIVIVHNNKIIDVLSKNQVDFQAKYLELLKKVYGNEISYLDEKTSEYICWKNII